MQKHIHDKTTTTNHRFAPPSTAMERGVGGDGFFIQKIGETGEYTINTAETIKQLSEKK